ncbi:P-loop containing nucleoside triphosphate hydrolase protein [Podospora conica]|nr:P-loop containing nucleoside triphosphate hydrolase protein [Schizothecium conicum]
MLVALRLQAPASASLLAAQRLSVHSSPAARTALLASLGTTTTTTSSSSSSTTPISIRRLSHLAHRSSGPPSVSAASQHGLHSRQPSALDLARLSKMLDPSAAKGTRAFSTVADRVHPALIKAIGTMGYTAMSPVQEQMLAVPDYTADFLVQAKTGTGKTIAFLVPALTNLLGMGKRLNRSDVSLLVVAPTRELAQQIAVECEKLTAHCVPPIETHVVVGGSGRASTLNKFMSGRPTITVATPGRLEDILKEQSVRDRFANIRTVVLDEADRMLDDGFLPAIKKILTTLPPKDKAGWQGMCFSATMPPAVNGILHHVLKPGHVRISTIDHNEAPTVDLVPQSVIPVSSVGDKLRTLHGLLSVERMADPNLKAIVFGSTANEVALNYHIFGSTGGAFSNFPVWQMHSRMSQPARTNTVEEFKQAPRGVLFASDVVGRGMDFPDIGLVVQCGLTTDSDQYVHRVGRTGRAGKNGRAVMIMDPHEMNFVKRNKQFPIKPAVLDPKAAQVKSAEAIESALAKIPEETKSRAYVSFLGFAVAASRTTSLSKPDTVYWANQYAASLGFEEPPPIQKRTIGMMGLKGVPGLNECANIAKPPRGPGNGGRQKQAPVAQSTSTTASRAPRDREAKLAAASAPSTRPPKAVRLETRAENRASGKSKKQKVAA